MLAPMKVLVVALTLLVAVLLGAYREAQGTATRRQDSIVALRLQLNSFSYRLSNDEYAISVMQGKIAHVCSGGHLVTSVYTNFSGQVLSTQVFC